MEVDGERKRQIISDVIVKIKEKHLKAQSVIAVCPTTGFVSDLVD